MQPEICAVGDSNTSVVAKAARPASPQWNSATKIAFRFAFVYFSLYNFYLPLHFLPFPPFSQIFALYSWACSLAVRLVSLRVLHLSHNFATDYLNTSAGSKDTTFDYVEVLCFFVVSVLATVIWSLLDRRRPNYQWLYKWFIVFLRLALAAAMIPYGAAKIFPSQFPEPALSKLLQPYGDSSPTDLFWTFMGASRTYSAFGGATEVLAGILLVVPRLATLGALVATAVMTNVLMLNVGYDVAVKLGCIHLILMAIIILLPDAFRLVDLFFLNRTTRLAPPRPLFQRVWLNRTSVALQIAFGVLLLGYNLHRTHQIASQVESAKNTPLYGIWSVDDFNGDSQANPAPPRWRRFIVESAGDATVQETTGSLQYLYFHPNSRMRAFSLTRYGDPGWIAEFTYDNSKPGFLFLTGTIAGRHTQIALHREDESKLQLKSHGFRWIQDAQ